MQSILDYFGNQLMEVKGHVAVRHLVYEGEKTYEVNSYHNQACVELERSKLNQRPVHTVTLRRVSSIFLKTVSACKYNSCRLYTADHLCCQFPFIWKGEGEKTTFPENTGEAPRLIIVFYRREAWAPLEFF